MISVRVIDPQNARAMAEVDITFIDKTITREQAARTVRRFFPHLVFHGIDKAGPDHERWICFLPDQSASPAFYLETSEEERLRMTLEEYPEVMQPLMRLAEERNSVP